MPAKKQKATTRKKLTVKKQTLTDLSPAKGKDPKGGYTAWTVGGLTSTYVVRKTI